MYQWDLSILMKIKEDLVVSKKWFDFDREQDIHLLEEMIRLRLEIPENSETFLIKARNITKNFYYYFKGVDEIQVMYLNHLKANVSLLKEEEEFTQYDSSQLLELLEQFIHWFPNPYLKQLLNVYYEQYFSSHFYCCDPDVLKSCGVTFHLNYYQIPFIIVKKINFEDTFLTIVHELGHVLSLLLESWASRKSKCSQLFSELDGQYFELLGLQFLREKGQEKIGVEHAKKNYNELVYCLHSIHDLFFSHVSLEDRLSDIYSYLGALELLNQYDQDYEKQLYKLYLILEQESNDLSLYLRKNDFGWREDKFASLKKHKQLLKK